jgi:cytochrome c biogenesis protein CcmG, thiol:disulfide interchange protein DsbE
VRRASFLIASLTLFLAGCYSNSRPRLIGKPAPQFTVQDSDRKITLSDFRGKVVVLNFWATWCPPCVEELPSLIQMQQQMKDKGVVVLAISVDEDKSSYDRFLKEHNVTLLTVRDEAMQSNNLYGTVKFPETYIIDRNGTVRRKFVGPLDWSQADILDYLNKLSAATPT